MNKTIGLISSSLAVIIGLYFAFSKSVELFGSTVNAAGSGLYLFIISAVILVTGVFKYENAAMETSKEPLN